MGYLQQQPEKKPSKPEEARLKNPGTLPWQGYHFSMKPYPHVPEDQGYSHEQQPQHWVASAAPDPGLVELPVRGLNTKPATVGLFNPTQRAVPDAPGSIQQGFSLMSAPLSVEVTTYHRQVEAHFPFLRAGQGISGPVTTFGLGDGLGACWPSLRISPLASFDRRHDEGLLAADEIPDDPDAVEASVQQEQADLYPKGSEPAHQGLEDLYHLVSFAHPAYGQGVTAAMKEQVSRGISEEMGSTLGGLAAADLTFILGLDTAMIRDLDQVNGDTPSLEAQPFGQRLGQELVEVAFQLVQVLQLAGQFSQDGSSTRGTLKLLTCLVDGGTGGGSKDQDIEEVFNLDLVSPSLQGKLPEELDGKLVYIVASQAIMKLVDHRDSPLLGLCVFPIIGESLDFYKVRCS